MKAAHSPQLSPLAGSEANRVRGSYVILRILRIPSYISGTEERSWKEEEHVSLDRSKKSHHGFFCGCEHVTSLSCMSPPPIVDSCELLIQSDTMYMTEGVQQYTSPTRHVEAAAHTSCVLSSYDTYVHVRHGTGQSLAHHTSHFRLSSTSNGLDYWARLKYNTKISFFSAPPAVLAS